VTLSRWVDTHQGSPKDGLNERWRNDGEAMGIYGTFMGKYHTKSSHSSRKMTIFMGNGKFHVIECAVM